MIRRRLVLRGRRAFRRLSTDSSRPALVRRGERPRRTCCCCRRHGQDEEGMVQRTHRPVAGQEFFHGSGTGPPQRTVQVSRDTRFENVSFIYTFKQYTARRQWTVRNIVPAATVSA